MTPPELVCTTPLSRFDGSLFTRGQPRNFRLFPHHNFEASVCAPIQFCQRPSRKRNALVLLLSVSSQIISLCANRKFGLQSSPLVKTVATRENFKSMVTPPIPQPKKLPRYGPFLTRYRSTLPHGDQDSVSTACSSKSGFGRHGRRVFSIKSSCSLESSSVSGIASRISTRGSPSQEKIEDVETSSQNTTVSKGPTAVPPVVVHIEKEEARESIASASRTEDSQRATEKSLDGVAVLDDYDIDGRCPSELPISHSCDQNSVHDISMKAEERAKADRRTSLKSAASIQSDNKLDVTQSCSELMDETVSKSVKQCLNSFCHLLQLQLTLTLIFRSNMKG